VDQCPVAASDGRRSIASIPLGQTTLLRWKAPGIDGIRRSGREVCAHGVPSRSNGLSVEGHRSDGLLRRQRHAEADERAPRARFRRPARRGAHEPRRIVYRGAKHIVAVAFDAAGAERLFGKPTVLFADDYEFGGGASIPNYDVTSDGRFIMIRRGPNGGKLRVILNWAEELTRVLAAGGVQ